MRCFLACLVVGALLCAAPLAAQQTGTITGTVTARENNAPVAGASVVIVGTARSVVTNPQGQYRLRVAPGSYLVRARAIGHEAAEQRVTVAAGETATADFRLAESPLALNEVVVVGSRTSRTAIETPVPVDVISIEEISQTGQTELNQILQAVAPSFNASHQTIADGSDHINPASLRGLGPDQVLVLVNGKRRHSPALVHVNGTFGRGMVGVDLNAIPAAAIERVEVLRDGAAAQYGSDAIAGVINIVLKDRTERLEASTTVGATPGGGRFADIADKHDGDQIKADVNYGFRVGERGFFNVTGEFLDRGATNRAAPWSGDIFLGITGTAATDAELASRGLTREDFTMEVGQAAATFGTAFYNAVVPLAGDAEFYSFGGFSHRNGVAGAFYRLPFQTDRTAPQTFPNGFLPEIHTGIADRSFSAGVRGNANGWDVDFSLTHGRNDFQFTVENTVNASMVGGTSPTTFDAGRLGFAQTTGNLDVLKPIPWAAVKAVSVVLGAEFRVENYRIEAGDAASWQRGNGGDSVGVDYDTIPGSGGVSKIFGAQGFPGFQPANEVNRFRNSISGYAGLETQLTDRLVVDVAGRYENYSDFGNTVNGKLALRYEVAPNWAVRGAVSTGFRAPSLHQVWFNNVSTQFVTVAGELQPEQVLTTNNEGRVTKAFGIPDLEEETSVNWSLGVTARPRDNLSITIDAYRITIDDRIVFTSQFRTTDTVVARIMAPFPSEGLTSVQFFTNAVDTRTHGIEAVVAYATGLGPGTLNLSASATVTETDVERINVPRAMVDTFRLANIASAIPILFNREEENRLEDALPRQKGTLSARYGLGRFNGLARATYYGSIRYRHPGGAASDERFGGKTLFDLDLAYEVTRGVTLAIGGNNIFNTFPDKQTKTSNISSGRFVYSRRVTQFGMNGGSYYARAQLSL